VRDRNIEAGVVLGQLISELNPRLGKLAWPSLELKTLATMMTAQAAISKLIIVWL